MLSREQLRAYQQRGVKHLKRHTRAGLFIDMGLGKTVITLTAILDLLKGGTVRKVLVVGPVRVIQGVWRQEAKKWAHLRSLRFKLLDGPESRRLKDLQSSAEIHLISPDNLPWLMRVLASRMRRNGWPYDMLVIDESSMFKTPKTRRFTLLRHRVKRFQRRVIMTGTPRPKGLENLWSQMFILDEGARLGETYDRFKGWYTKPTGFMNRKRQVNEEDEGEILEKIGDIVLTMRAEDYLDLPKELNQTIRIDLPPKARAMYEKFEAEMFLELENGTAEALTAATLSAKCWQMANGFMYLEDRAGDRTWQAVHDAKLEALKAIYDETSGNLLVCYWFKPDLLRLRKLFPKAPAIADAKNDRELNLMQKRWNAGEYPVMFLHPQGSGHGLNLQDGGNEMVFYSMLWGREPYAQVRERIGAARQVGKRDHVSYKYLIAQGTVDEAMLMTQRERHQNERQMLKTLSDYRRIKELLA